VSTSGSRVWSPKPVDHHTAKLDMTKQRLVIDYSGVTPIDVVSR